MACFHWKFRNFIEFSFRFDGSAKGLLFTLFICNLGLLFDVDLPIFSCLKWNIEFLFYEPENLKLIGINSIYLFGYDTLR